MEEVKKSGLATAGLVLGIVGVCLSFIPIVNNAAFVLGVLAIIFGLIPFFKKRAKTKAIIAAVLGIVAIAATLYSQASLVKTIDDSLQDLNDELSAMTGEATDEILKNHLDVTLGEFTATEDEFLPETKLEVKVKNKSDEKKSFSVLVEAVDENGARINTDTVFVNDLNAGQEQTIEIFNFVASDEIESLKKASFKIVEASMY